MIDEPDLPDTPCGRAAMLENLMTARATGNLSASRSDYEHLRQDFMQDPTTKALLPEFVKSCRSLDVFWPVIQKESGTYAGRRQIISAAFGPLADFLAGKGQSHVDYDASEILLSFDTDGVHAVWTKALIRRNTEPEGAITVARTLLETVCQRILDGQSINYTDKEDLPKLYSMVAKSLNLAPDQHSEEPIKAILGGAMNLVNGIGTLRNRLSDSHERGGKPVRPSARHASLAVNPAGAVSVFLVETFIEKRLAVE